MRQLPVSPISHIRIYQKLKQIHTHPGIISFPGKHNKWDMFSLWTLNQKNVYVYII